LAVRPEVGVEQIAVLLGLYWAASANRAFLDGALHGMAANEPRTWALAAALLVMLVALHTIILGLLCNRWTVKPVLAVLVGVGAVASHYTAAYGVYLDPSMLRNLLRSNPQEAGELIGTGLFMHLAVFAGPPWLLLWRVRVRQRPWRRAAALRAAWLVAATGVLIASVMLMFQPLASMMRNQRELRYLITPANVLWSTGAVLAADARGAAKPQQPIGLDAAPGPSWARRDKPLLVVLVVGETARAANWGLNAGQPGYGPRDTTPELARLVAGGALINVPGVRSCGTNTETSLPCMFAPVGRRDYDEARIRGQQSLLHVAARAGVDVLWRDNQSGCKGVCDGLPTEALQAAAPAAPCADGHCFDEALLHDLDQRLAQARGTQLLVLHTMGSHGPSYFRRYPRAFAHFQPECLEDDLRRCGAEAIRNAYDNTLRYTDHVLAGAIGTLRAHAGRVDSALVYVSDHGESLGEYGLFLHGVPYAMAPDVQTRVPMVAWVSPGLEHAAGLAPGCLRTVLTSARDPLTHDHLFPFVLGLLDVRTGLRDPAWDLLATCRTEPAPG
jgi:lipid A ethanolaminephosphotransferase